MSLGTLNRHLILEESTRVSDGAGGYTEAWLVVGDLWGSVKAGTGRETLGGRAALSSVPYKIKIRSAPDGSPSGRDLISAFGNGHGYFAFFLWQMPMRINAI